MIHRQVISLFCCGLCLLNAKLIAIHQFAINRLHRCFCLTGFGNLNKTKSFRQPGILIQYQVTSLNMAESGEKSQKIRLGGSACEIFE